MAEGWGDDEMNRIAAFVAARNGGLQEWEDLPAIPGDQRRVEGKHPNRCACRSCAKDWACGGGWCRYCNTEMDQHKLVDEDRPACPAGSGMR